MTKGTAVASTRTLRSVSDLLTKARPQIESVATKAISAERLIKVALLAMSKNQLILDCSTESLVLCLMQSAQVGLEPNGRDAALVPYFNKKTKRYEAQFQTMYRGQVKLIVRGSEYRHIEAVAVFEKDEFGYERGLEPALAHRPSLEGDAGPLTHVYMIARPSDPNTPPGLHPFEVMTKAQVEHVRKKSKNASRGPWVDDYPEMAKKTVINRGCKLLDLHEDAREQLDKADEIEFEYMPPEATKEIEVPKSRTAKVKEKIKADDKPTPEQKEKSDLDKKRLDLLKLREEAQAEPDILDSDAQQDISDVLEAKNEDGIDMWIAELNHRLGGAGRAEEELLLTG